PSPITTASSGSRCGSWRTARSQRRGRGKRSSPLGLWPLQPFLLRRRRRELRRREGGGRRGVRPFLGRTARKRRLRASVAVRGVVSLACPRRRRARPHGRCGEGSIERNSGGSGMIPVVAEQTGVLRRLHGLMDLEEEALKSALLAE